MTIAALSACAEEPAISPAAVEADLAVLTLNLHGYREIETPGVAEEALTDALAKDRIAAYAPIFDRLAAGIIELDPDIVCLQEVGEWPDTPTAEQVLPEFGASDSNMVHQLLSRLPGDRYHYTMDWSHYGWTVWLEGSAILSKFPLVQTDSRFISDPAMRAPRRNFKSRNVPMATVVVPGFGDVSVFSVHAGWWDDTEEPFKAQYQRLLEWVGQATRTSNVTILCGDFNVAAGSEGYQFIVENGGFSDQYALANPSGFNDATIAIGADGWENDGSGQRIDYILVDNVQLLRAVRARRVFTGRDFGRVSDHVGVFIEFRKSELSQ